MDLRKNPEEKKIQSNVLILPLAGKARHGKDTTAEMLKGKLGNLGYDVLIMHFSDQLKFGCTSYLGWDGKKDEYGRTLLQQVGTEEMRHKYPDFWVDNICKWIDGVLASRYNVFIVADARFENEINHFHRFPFSFGVEVCPTKVVRLGHKSELTDEQQQHASETSLDGYDRFHYGVYAEDGLESLEQEVDRMIQWMDKANILPKNLNDRTVF